MRNHSYSPHGINHVSYGKLLWLKRRACSEQNVWFFINLTSTGNYLLEIRWCCYCQFRLCTHYCFSKRDQGSTFKWLIISISSFSNPSISGCHSFSPNAVCYECFHISQGKSINYPLFFRYSHLPSTSQSSFPRFSPGGWCASWLMRKDVGLSGLCLVNDTKW